MNKLTSPKRVGFYLRVSTERQARVEEGSLKNQEQRLRAELERRNAQHIGWGRLVESYIDEGISAKNTNRPAFQQLMRDIELRAIDTVMFTELSRLSRSLKDFLGIFEFARRNECDLICLKTDIDTTSPYQDLVTKILIVFSEFEREMASQRTAINAYERSKRGLANGGQTLLGYRRDKNHKGHLLVKESEAEVVQKIFQMYVRKRSIRHITEQIKVRYEDRVPRLKQISPSTVYGVLTNKAYLGIRTINKRNKANYEEVGAAWEPIIKGKLFQEAQEILKINKDRFHRHGPQRYLYLLSGLLCCGKCGEKLSGKSAYSSSAKRHNYYAHRSICAQGGPSRMDAESLEKMVLDWLRDITLKGGQFLELQAQGRERISRQKEELLEESRHLESELSLLRKRSEEHIQELTRAKVEMVRQSIEQSIVGIELERREADKQQAFIKHSVSELQNLLSEDGSLIEYGRRIKEVLESVGDQQKMALRTLITSLVLQDDGLRIALSSVGRKAARSSESFSSSTIIREFPLSLIEGTIRHRNCPIAKHSTTVSSKKPPL